jgi:glycosyltransferase involved in cell wall biosynthesis
MDSSKINKKFKVVFVSAVADFKGGAEKCLQQFMLNPMLTPILIVPALGELSIYAEQHNITVEVIDYGCVNNVRRPFKISAIFYAAIDAIKVSWQIKRLAKHVGAVCIHSNGLKTHGILSVGWLFGCVPVICHIHDIPYTSKERFFWKYLSWTTKRLLLVSKYCWVNDSLPKNASVIPNGIAISQKSLLQKSFENEIKIGFVGRIHPHKGLHLAIEWLIAAKAAGIKFQFFIRGEAAPAEHEYLNQIKQTILDAGLNDYCHFQGRILDYKKVYSSIDITLMPSVIAEPFGLVAIESFDNGVPCFAYPSGALPSIIEHGKSGYLCENSTEFVKSLRSLLANNNNYNQIRTQAHEQLIEKFSIKSLYNNLNKEYERVNV